MDCAASSALSFYTMLSRRKTTGFWKASASSGKKSPLTRNQQVLFRTADGKEYRFSLEKNTRLLAGHSYRLYFKKESPLGENAGDLLHTPALIGYEELMEVAAEE